jgi:hypothetical protein
MLRSEMPTRLSFRGLTLWSLRLGGLRLGVLRLGVLRLGVLRLGVLRPHAAVHGASVVVGLGLHALAFAQGLQSAERDLHLRQESQQVAPRSSAQESIQDILSSRLDQIELDREASQAQFRSDKKSCAGAVLVNRCVSDAVSRRRARDAVLKDAQIHTKEQLRAIAAKHKNSELAASQARAEQETSDEARREEGNAQRAKKLADAQERAEAHQQKKNQEAENRRLYLEKLQRSEEKQAEIRARFRANGTQPKASAN